MGGIWDGVQACAPPPTLQAQSTADEDVEKRAQLHEFLERVSRLRHPHIISVLDIWETAEALWYVTDFCETGSLQTYVQPVPA